MSVLCLDDMMLSMGKIPYEGADTAGNGPAQPMWILFYDGPCALCNFLVKWLLRADRKERICFAALGSAHALPWQHQLQEEDTLILTDGKQAWTRAAAIFQVLRLLGGGYKAGLFFTIFPTSWMNGLYNCVARNRYRLQKQPTACPLPDPATRHRFL